MFPISHISTKKARSISGKESRNPKSTWSMAVAAQRVASRNTKQMFTVESDAAFLRAVRKRLKSIPEPHSQVTLIFVNIGLTRSGESRYLKGRQEDVWRGGDTTWLRHGKNCELLESNRTPFLLTAAFASPACFNRCSISAVDVIALSWSTTTLTVRNITPLKNSRTFMRCMAVWPSWRKREKFDAEGCRQSSSNTNGIGDRGRCGFGEGLTDGRHGRPPRSRTHSVD
jgi:hypothetical protein